MRLEFSPDGTESELLAWQNTLTGLVLNGERISFDDILLMLYSRAAE
ncbi:MAG TPA: hypothetical protein VJZ27_10915 [Aggregatilineales bacterium]|nr:hypothetical protein [Aggregatilineales bacterium]